MSSSKSRYRRIVEDVLFWGIVCTLIFIVSFLPALYFHMAFLAGVK